MKVYEARFHVYRCGHLCSWITDLGPTHVIYPSRLDCCRCPDSSQMGPPHSHCLSLSRGTQWVKHPSH